MHKAWCASYEFSAGSCKLYAAPGAPATATYDACPKASARQEAQASAAAAVSAAQEAAVVRPAKRGVPANAKRCLRIADADFDSWFLVKTPSRKGTEADCDHACNNETSIHHAWCVGFAFQVLPNGAGTCNLYDTCETLNAVPDAERAVVESSQQLSKGQQRYGRALQRLKRLERLR